MLGLLVFLNYPYVQMTASLVGATDLQRYTQIEWDKTTTFLKSAVAKAEKTRDKAEKEKKAFESQCAVLESEKVVLTKALGEAKTVRDEVVAMVDSLKFEDRKSTRLNSSHRP